MEEKKPPPSQLCILNAVADPGGLAGLRRGPLFSNYNLPFQTEIHLLNPDFYYWFHQPTLTLTIIVLRPIWLPSAQFDYPPPNLITLRPIWLPSAQF